MDITRTTHYTLRTLVELAMHGENEVVSSKDISERQMIPRSYLPKIVLILSTKGFVRTERGKMGGLRLAVDPAKITLLDILEAVEGPLSFNRCALYPEECPHGSVCPLGLAWDHVQEVFANELRKITVKDLAEKVKEQLAKDREAAQKGGAE